ncbi:MAG: hypothetical protein HFI45_12740 [Lachnospiraceae bacterium]|nr:hypothetical protein [Lachnospiraceae bacterium]
MDYLERSVREYEKEYETLRKYQIMDREDADFGGYYSKDFGVVAENCGGAAAKPMVLYFCQKSRYYKDPEALRCAEGLIEHLINHLHSDGTIDYFACNFHSAPDTAFVALALAKPAKLIDAGTQEEKVLKEKLFYLLKRMGDGMVVEGFHTPNHRWVISAALALIHSLIPDESYLERIGQYLAEGIDCNEDGEFAERSAGGYNEINNRALLILAQELEKTELLEFVRRNLKMMPVFYHTDFSIFTENSKRQDKGTAPYAEKYAYQYLLCGYALKDERLRAIGVSLLKECMENGRRFPLAVEDLMLFPEAFGNLPEPAGRELFEVDRLLKESGLLRLSRKGLNLWAVEGQPSFLFLKKGDIDFYIKGGISFFNCRHLLMENIRADGNGYEMEYEGTGKYYQPFGEYQGTSDWWEMDQAARRTTGHISVKVNVTVTPVEDGYDIRIHTSGCPASTIRFELGVVPNVLIKGGGFRIPASAGGTLIAERGELCLFDGKDTVCIGPAFAANDVINGLFGAVPASGQRFNIFFNDVTNFDRCLSIRVK